MTTITVVVNSIKRDAQGGLKFTKLDNPDCTFRRFDTERLAEPVSVEVTMDHNAIIALAHRAAANRNGTATLGGMRARVTVPATFTTTPAEANEEGWTAERFGDPTPTKAVTT